MPIDTINQLIAECQTLLGNLRALNSGTPIVVQSLSEKLKAVEDEIQIQWASAGDDKKQKWESDLQAIRDSFQSMLDDGPADPGSEMHKAFASNHRILLVSLFSIIGVGLILGFLVWKSSKFLSCGLPQEVVCSLPLITVMGALGGFLSCIQSFGRYVGNRQFLKSWTLYYILFPLKGAGLAVIVFFLIHTDLGEVNLNLTGMAIPETNTVLLLSTTNSLPAGGTGTNVAMAAAGGKTNAPVARIELVSRQERNLKKPNLVIASLVAALTGMFANQAIEMLASVFAIIFQRVQGKDRIRDNNDGGAAVKRKT